MFVDYIWGLVLIVCALVIGALMVCIDLEIKKENKEDKK